jgi:hypothetical protein
LADVPQFDDWGLWAYGDVRLSRAGTLLETQEASVTQSPGGLTVSELEERLQTPVANLLSRLVQHGRLACQRLSGRHVVYLSSVTEQGQQQWTQRQQDCRRVAVAAAAGLPVGCPTPLVIAVPSGAGYAFDLIAHVGEDLYEAPQAALSKRVRTLKLQYRLKEQRRGQNEWLRSG